MSIKDQLYCLWCGLNDLESSPTFGSIDKAMDEVEKETIKKLQE